MILFHESSRQFHLFNDQISYIIEVMDNGQLANLYYGSAIRDRQSFTYLRERFGQHLDAEAAPTSLLTLQFTRQEYPAYGTGDFRYPAYRIRQEKGSLISGFVYESHQIFSGKKEILPLPSLTRKRRTPTALKSRCLTRSRKPG